MATNEPASSQRGGSSEQSIEELQRRYQGLHTKKTQAETLRDEAKKRLDELKAQARDKYGTDDASELQKKLDDMVADNARKVAEYKRPTWTRSIKGWPRSSASSRQRRHRNRHRTLGSFGDERLSITTRIRPRHQIA